MRGGVVIKLSIFTNFFLKLLFFISLVAPQIVTEISFFLASILLFLNSIYSKLTFDRSTLVLFILGGLLFIGLYGSLLGVYFENDFVGIYSNFKIYFVYSLFGFLLIPLIKRFISIDDIFQVCFISSFFTLALYIYPFLLLYFNFDAFLPVYFDFIFPVISFYEGRYVINSLSVPSLVILFPIVLFLYFDNKIYTKKRFVLFFTLLSLVLLILISGRRMIWILSFFAFFWLIWARLNNVYLKLFLWFVGLSVAMYSYNNLSDFFMISSEFSQDSTRYVQIFMLLESFILNPFGVGFGSLFYDIRGYETWLFELAWFKLLADTGIVSLFWFLFVFIYGYRHRLKTYSQFYLDGFYLSLAFWFFIGFSNPAFFNFDGLVILCMLLAVITNCNCNPPKN
jgi:hypothetical protein